MAEVGSPQQRKLKKSIAEDSSKGTQSPFSLKSQSINQDTKMSEAVGKEELFKVIHEQKKMLSQMMNEK